MRILAVFMLALLAAACASVDVQSQLDRNYDFSRLQHFSWTGEAPDVRGDPSFARPQADDNLRRMITEAFQARGYEYVRQEEADFILSYRMVVEQRLDERVLNNNLEMGPGWGYDTIDAAQYQKGTASTYVMEYTEGTLILDAVEANGTHLIWRGSAAGELHLEMSPEQREQRARKAIDRLVKRFPAR